MTTARSTYDHTVHQASSEFGRSARVNRTPDGDPIGASIFLTAQQLDDLGFHPVQLEALVYAVQNGELRLAGSPNRDDLLEERAQTASHRRDHV